MMKVDTSHQPANHPRNVNDKPDPEKAEKFKRLIEKAPTDKNTGACEPDKTERPPNNSAVCTYFWDNVNAINSGAIVADGKCPKCGEAPCQCYSGV